MNPPTRAACARLAPLAGLAALLAGASSGAPEPAPRASSHREAPFVTEHPKVDATDFYMFTSYEPGREDHVVLVANYLPLQDAYGGPNYFVMDPRAVYRIHIDNDGDAQEDITFRFQFRSELEGISLPVGPSGQEVDVAVPLRFVGPVDATSDAALNEKEFFGVSVTRETGGMSVSDRIVDATTGSAWFRKPLDNVGEKTISDYPAYADAFEYDVLLPGGALGRAFVGQRKDPFVVNLGETFDLVNNDPLGPPDAKRNSLECKNVTSLILEVPRSFLTAPGQDVIGAWTTASMPRTRELLEDPSFEQPVESSSAHVQVSRLGSPLVNELVIGLPDKNRFNASHPARDAQFLDYVTNPTLPELLQVLFGVTAPDLFPRTDLVQAFLTGVPGLNENGSVGEMLRLNTAIPPTPLGSQEPLGVLSADLAGFPNGRRPGDDVVDIALRVVMGVLLDPAVAPDGQLPYTDGAYVDATFFDGSFPFLLDPLPGSPQQSSPPCAN